MSNDWNQPPGPGQDPFGQPQQPQQPQPQHDPFAGHAQPGLAGGVYDPTFDDVVENIKTVAGRFLGPILAVWVGIFAIDFLFVLFAIVVSAVSFEGVFGSATEFVFYGLTGVNVIRGVIMTALRASLFAPLKQMLVQGPQSVDGIGGVAKSALSRAIPVAITSVIVSVIVGIGVVFCVIPGLVAGFLLMMSTFYAAVGHNPIEALTESFESAKKYWALLLGAVAVVIFVTGLIVIGGSITSAISIAILKEYAFIGIQLGNWLITALLGVVIWIVTGAVFVTIDTAESGESIIH